MHSICLLIGLTLSTFLRLDSDDQKIIIHRFDVIIIVIYYYYYHHRQRKIGKHFNLSQVRSRGRRIVACIVCCYSVLTIHTLTMSVMNYIHTQTHAHTTGINTLWMIEM